jgi:AraC-like DNA-binding protein
LTVHGAIAFNARPMTKSPSSPLVPRTRFETSAFHGCDQFDAWRELISVAFNVDPLDASIADGFRATLDGFHLGDIVLMQGRFVAQRFVRTATRARSDMLDHFLVHVFKEGGYRGDVDGRNVEVPSGAVAIFDLARAVDVRAEASDCMALVVPRDLLEPVLPAGTSLHGLTLDAGGSALLSSYLNALCDQLPTAQTRQAGHLARATVGLLAACILPCLDRREQRSDQGDSAVLNKVRAYIERSLSSTELSPEQICWALQVSRTQLYELFRGVGGVRRYIQHRRLNRVHHALSDPSERASIAELAERFGFTTHAHLSRAFREHFNYSPSDVRIDSSIVVRARVASGGAEPVRDTLGDWVRGLRAQAQHDVHE